MINDPILAKLRSDFDDDEELFSFFSLYFSESKANLAAIKTSLEANELESLKFYVHKEGSASLIFGLDDYGNYLRRMESKIDDGDFEIEDTDFSMLFDLANSSHTLLRDHIELRLGLSNSLTSY